MNSLDRDDARVIIALDYPDAKQARQLVEQLDVHSCKLKIGKELFTREGPEMVRYFVAQGFDIFLDLKFHDIPNTVAKACQAAAELGVWMINVHASGGGKMMRAAREALSELPSSPLLIGVTVLTSMNADDLQELGISVSPAEQVLRLAKLAKESGLDGVVCSGHEASVLRAELGDAFTLVTPGVRPAGASMDDQSRVLTPADAIRSGANYLVIGRPITKADDPAAALSAIAKDIT